MHLVNKFEKLLKTNIVVNLVRNSSAEKNKFKSWTIFFFQDDAELGPLEPDWEDEGGDGHERARRMFKELDQER